MVGNDKDSWITRIFIHDDKNVFIIVIRKRQDSVAEIIKDAIEFEVDLFVDWREWSAVLLFENTIVAAVDVKIDVEEL